MWQRPPATPRARDGLRYVASILLIPRRVIFLTIPIAQTAVAEPLASTVARIGRGTVISTQPYWCCLSLRIIRKNILLPLTAVHSHIHVIERLCPRAASASARRLAALQPKLVLFGHGPPLRDPVALSAFAAALID